MISIASALTRALAILGIIAATSPRVLAQATAGGDSQYSGRAGALLREHLQRVATAQAAFRLWRQTYASTLAELVRYGAHFYGGYRPSPGITILIEDASEVGWRGIAIYDPLPAIACTIYHGTVNEHLPQEQVDEPQCFGESLPDSLVAPQFIFLPALLEEVPHTVACSRQFALPPEQSGPIRFQYVIGADGRAEGPSLRILESADSVSVTSLVEYVSSCLYRPGRVCGAAVRVLVEQEMRTAPE